MRRIREGFSLLPGLFTALVFAFAAGGETTDSLALDSARESEINRIQEQADKIRTLVEAGVAPRVQLERLESEIADARDDAVLRNTLYGAIGVEDLTEEQAATMVNAAQRRLERQQERVNEANRLVDSGVAGRLTVTPFVEELSHRQQALNLANSRANLIRQLAEMARAEEESAELSRRSAPAEDGSLSDRDIEAIEAAFSRRFGRALPVSARGETATHRTLGFDHRGRVDIALNPDTREGAWLRTYLDTEGIPYIPFRSAVRGKATGPHIHVGPPSLRLRAIAD